jgi:hypothetical protein
MGKISYTWVQIWVEYYTNYTGMIVVLLYSSHCHPFFFLVSNV